jgi:hypothetical protein
MELFPWCVATPVHASTGNSGNVSAETFGKMPLTFVPNEGQLAGKIRYYEQGVGHGTGSAVCTRDAGAA